MYECFSGLIRVIQFLGKPVSPKTHLLIRAERHLVYACVASCIHGCISSANHDRFERPAILGHCCMRVRGRDRHSVIDLACERSVFKIYKQKSTPTHPLEGGWFGVLIFIGGFSCNESYIYIN